MRIVMLLSYWFGVLRSVAKLLLGRHSDHQTISSLAITSPARPPIIVFDLNHRQPLLSLLFALTLIFSLSLLSLLSSTATPLGHVYLFISTLVLCLQLEPSPGMASTLSWSGGSSTSESDPLSEANRRLLTGEWLCPSIRMEPLTDLILLYFRCVSVGLVSSRRSTP